MSKLDKFDSILTKCINSYLEDGMFFTPWFKEFGKAYYFTFKENLSRTNIQYGEIKSLIISNLVDNRSIEKCPNENIHIFKVQDFNQSIKLILSSYSFPIDEYRNLKNHQNNNKDRLKELSAIAKKVSNSVICSYRDLLSRTIIIDPFYNSCAVYLPNNLNLNLFEIIANSGYINTCGDLIYIRNFKKTDTAVFFENVNLKIKNLMEDNKVQNIINFNVFSHEDFCDKLGINCDLEYLKIHLDKYCFDGKPLISVLYELKDKFEHKLNVNIVSNQKIENTYSQSIWLVKDSSISDNLKQPGENNYFICYLQKYKNDNQLQIFNENKPAWKSNTSIPHDLIAAMINISLEGRDKSEVIKIIDPFLGCGTTFIELIKSNIFYKNLKIYGSDISPSTTLLLKDNLQIMSMSVSELMDLIDNLEQKGIYDKMLRIKENLSLFYLDGQSELDIDEKNIELLNKLHLIDRLLLYTYFKVRISKSIDIIRKHDFDNYIVKELEKLIKELKTLHETNSLLKENSSSEIKGVKIVDGHFSSKIILDPSIFKIQLGKLNNDDNKQLVIGDFQNLNHDEYDIIICDPPYGFNANNNLDILIDLYDKLPEKLISLLKKNGQIMMSLPDESYSGKHSPWFTHKEIVIAKFHHASHKLGRKMFSFSEINPRKDLYNAPYYWEAQRALRRSIINLKFN